MNDVICEGLPSNTSITEIPSLDYKYLLDTVIISMSLNNKQTDMEIYKENSPKMKPFLFVNKILMDFFVEKYNREVSPQIEESLFEILEDKKTDSETSQKKLLGLISNFYYNQSLPVAHHIFEKRKKSTLLHFICKKNWIFLYQILVDLFFCDENVKDSKGKTPREYFPNKK